MRSTPSRRSDDSHSCRMESGRSTRRASFMRSRSSHTSRHLVNTSGRSRDGSSRKRRPTSSSEWPRPYTAAVSIQLIPSSSARCIAASESVSSCGPQPNAQPPPPIAHAPKPTVVISSPLEPSGRVGNVIRTTPGDRRLGNQQHLPRGLASFQQPVRLRRLRERELALDAHRQFSALAPAQQLAGPREQLRARRDVVRQRGPGEEQDRKSTRLNSSHSQISYAVFCLKKKNLNCHCRFPYISAYQYRQSNESLFPAFTARLAPCLRVTTTIISILSPSARTTRSLRCEM